MSFSRLFHSQRGLRDWDGRGQPIQNERINCKAHYNQSASFDFQLCTWLTGYGNGYGRLGSASICSFAFIMAAKYSLHSGRPKRQLVISPSLSTSCFTGRALCQRSFLSLFLGLYRSSQASSPTWACNAKAVKLKTTRNSSGCLIISRQLAPWSAHFTS